MAARKIDRLIEIMAQLRHPTDGCPWDTAQNFRSIAPHTIEEAYEVADAIEHGDRDDLREELGDLLLQVVFHARMAEEEKSFDFEDVASTIADKLVRRHPHVFDTKNHDPNSDLYDNWEEHKARERAQKYKARGVALNILDAVPIALPALTRAEKLQKRAAHAGFDWPSLKPVIAKLEEELAELKSEINNKSTPDRIADEMGDLLFSCVNLARHLKIDPEDSLRSANAKFVRRFRYVEKTIQRNGETVEHADLDALEKSWQQAKDHGL